MPVCSSVRSFLYNECSDIGPRVLRLGSSISFYSKLLKISRQTLKIVAYIYEGDVSKAEIRGRIKVAQTSLKTISVVINIVRIPGKLHKIFRVTVSVISDTQEIISEIRAVGIVPRKKILKNVTRVFYLVNTGTGVIKKGIYDPVLLTHKFYPLGSVSDSMKQQCQVLGFIKRGSKICLLVGKILQGKKVAKCSFQLVVFQVPGLVFDILDVADVPVHPAVKLSFGTVKSVYGLAKVWHATA